jgi:uncharacterized membrane protein YczE
MKKLIAVIILTYISVLMEAWSLTGPVGLGIIIGLTIAGVLAVIPKKGETR